MSPSHLQHIDKSCHVYGEVVHNILTRQHSHLNKSLTSHLQHRGKSCHTYWQVMSYIWRSHSQHIDTLSFKSSQVVYTMVASHITHHTYWQVMSHITHIDKSCYTEYIWQVMSYTLTSHLTYIDKSRHTYWQVTSHVTHTDKSCHTHWQVIYNILTRHLTRRIHLLQHLLQRDRWLVNVYHMTCQCVWHDLSVCVTWLATMV